MIALLKCIFLRNQSLSNAGWFCNKKRKIGKGNLYLTKNGLGRNDISYAEDYHSYMSNICAKEFSDSNFNEAVIGKISIFQEIASDWNFLDQLLLLYKFHSSSKRGISFSILSVVHKLLKSSYLNICDIQHKIQIHTVLLFEYMADDIVILYK